MDPRFYRFPSHLFIMLKPGKPIPPNTATFRVPLSLSKPVIANYLEQVYRVRVERVDTAVYVGKEKRNVFTGRAYKKADWKKAIVRIAAEEGKEAWVYPSLEQQQKWSEESNKSKPSQ